MNNDWKNLKIGVIGVVLALSVATGASAKEKPPLTSELVAMKVLKVDAEREMLIAASEAAPGDLIEYQVKYTNNTSRVLRGIEATLPIPVGVAYQAKSAVPRRFTASTDQQTFDTVPLRKIEAGADGSRKVIKVPYDQYRALRWKIGKLGAGRSTLVKARARILSTSAGE